ncbi:hypothetical protein [Oceanimonas smirnovii]|uniref:hypothetical protein n=1 Tax=Oceanimonas smirnovii TaxID=264574 RepID=UPI0003608449|nr:hypothetical protein [Oceanimonas smirnovii]
MNYYFLIIFMGIWPFLAHAEVADKIISYDKMLVFLGAISLILILILKLKTHWFLWPYAIFLLFLIIGEIDFIMIDNEIFYLAINELGPSYKYITYTYLASLTLLLLSTIYFIFMKKLHRD